MKKKTSLYIFPLIALVIFFAVYWNFSSNYEQKQAERAADHRKKVEASEQLQNQQRLKAVNDAIAAQKMRKEQREAKEAADRKEVDDRNMAIQARDKTYADVLSTRDKVDRLKSDVKTAQAELDRVLEDKRSKVAQLDFLEIDVKRADASQEVYTNVLKEIAAADAAVAAAARAAAAAAAAAAK